jgi:D-alanyl-lipoteichoic acid acyltransferase DltB (MBOAT superfamily)
MMMAANLVGFAIGLDGLKEMIRGEILVSVSKKGKLTMYGIGVFNSYQGVAFITLALVSIFVGVQVMFEIREAERRTGINLKC